MVLFLQVLLGPDDAVLSDELNHASIIDGIRLCRAKRLRYKHMDLSDLESRLKESQVFVDPRQEEAIGEGGLVNSTFFYQLNNVSTFLHVKCEP